MLLFSTDEYYSCKKYKFCGIHIHSSKSEVLEEKGELVTLVCDPTNIVDSSEIEVVTKRKSTHIG